ncbi:MAG: ABC transporter substrate-binding protein [Acetivibrionales bacterium]|jgi:ribose transport system substrate-binding protein
MKNKLYIITSMVLVVLVFGISFTFTGCPGKRNITIGLSNGYIGNNWRTQMLEDVMVSFEKYKKEGLVDKIIVQNAGLDVNNQIAQIRNMIKDNVDLLMIDPNSETALNPVIEEAYKKGIPVIAFDQPVSSPYAINIVIDQQKWGENLAKWLVEELKGEGEIVIVEGLKGHPANENRLVGMRRVLDQYPGIKVLASENANWDQANAQQVMLNLLYTYPHIDGVLTQDGMCLGILKAYKAVGRPLPTITGETMVGFMRMWKELKDCEGFKTFAMNNPPGISSTALGIAVRILQGRELKPLPGNTLFYPVDDYITNENLERYIEQVQDKPDTYFLDEWLSENELDALFK